MMKLRAMEWAPGCQKKAEGQHGSEADQGGIGEDADHTELCQADQQDETADKDYRAHFHVLPQENVSDVHLANKVRGDFS